MGWTPSEKEALSIARLHAAERFEYAVKHMADEGALWSLWSDGWALCEDAGHALHVPVWPHPVYAGACVLDLWEGFAPRSIGLVEWLERWTDGLIRDERLIAVFPTTQDKGVSIDPAAFARALERESERLG